MEHRARRHGSWLPIAQLTTLLGNVLAVEHWGLALMVATSFTISLFSWGVLGTMWGAGGSAEIPRILRRGLDVGLMSTAFAGLATTLGVSSVLLAGILAISHPQVRKAIGRSWATLVTHPAGPVPKPDDLHNLTNATLCALWQSSHGRLRTCRNAAAEAGVVQLRQLYLDELERRDPEGLGAWFASGAYADGSPLPFLRQGHGSQT